MKLPSRPSPHSRHEFAVDGANDSWSDLFAFAFAFAFVFVIAIAIAILAQTGANNTFNSATFSA